jgi:hypothetical protein
VNRPRIRYVSSIIIIGKYKTTVGTHIFTLGIIKTLYGVAIITVGTFKTPTLTFITTEGINNYRLGINVYRLGSVKTPYGRKSYLLTCSTSTY